MAEYWTCPGQEYVVHTVTNVQGGILFNPHFLGYLTMALSLAITVLAAWAYRVGRRRGWQEAHGLLPPEQPTLKKDPHSDESD